MEIPPPQFPEGHLMFVLLLVFLGVLVVLLLEVLGVLVVVVLLLVALSLVVPMVLVILEVLLLILLMALVVLVALTLEVNLAEVHRLINLFRSLCISPLTEATGGYMPYQYYQYVESNHQLPFLATLDLPKLFKLINDPIQHNSSWPLIPVKLPSDISKFNGKQGDDPKNHVMTFHLWCSSNSLMDDSIRLRLFQRTLTSTATKWYIELP